jgi:hypothetical protein
MLLPLTAAVISMTSPMNALAERADQAPHELAARC